MTAKRNISVFIASPGDLVEERQAFRQVCDELNGDFSEGANVTFEPLGWEDTLATTGRRNQSVINEDINQCDVFILSLHRRWGQTVPDSDYSSYTEEEFHLALDRFRKTQTPEIFVFFKRVDPGQEADPGPQLEKVMTFRRTLEDSREVLYRNFDNDAGFAQEVRRHLIAFAKGDLTKVSQKNTSILPLSAIKKIDAAQQATAQALKKAEQAEQRAEQAYLKTESLQLTLAKQAAEAANEGKLEAARQIFAKAVEGTTNTTVLYLASKFFHQIGELNVAKRYIEHWLTISGEQSKSSDTAAAFGNLGLIHQTRGDLDKAEEFHLKSLEIKETLGLKQGMATTYGNLGLIHQTRGDLDKAEEFQLKSLEIEETLGRKEGMASSYGNLGNIHQIRGDLDKAEEFQLKSLEIRETLGLKEGMAISYANLGVIFELREDLQTSKELWHKSIKLYKEMGATHMAEKVQSWLDDLQ